MGAGLSSQWQTNRGLGEDIQSLHVAFWFKPAAITQITDRMMSWSDQSGGTSRLGQPSSIGSNKPDGSALDQRLGTSVLEADNEVVKGG